MLAAGGQQAGPCLLALRRQQLLEGQMVQPLLPLPLPLPLLLLLLLLLLLHLMLLLQPAAMHLDRLLPLARLLHLQVLALAEAEQWSGVAMLQKSRLAALWGLAGCEFAGSGAGELERVWEEAGGGVQYELTDTVRAAAGRLLEHAAGGRRVRQGC